MNLERLEEALEVWDKFQNPTDVRPNRERAVEATYVLVDAAREWLRWGPAVEAAEEVDWCNAHGASVLVGLDRCGQYLFAEPLFEGDPDPGPCDIEPVLVVRRRLLAEEPE